MSAPRLVVLANFVAGAASPTGPLNVLFCFFLSSFALVYLVRCQHWCWCARYRLDAFAEHLRLGGFFLKKIFFLEVGKSWTENKKRYITLRKQLWLTDASSLMIVDHSVSSSP